MIRGMPIPREHGAWAMLYAPFLAGWIVTGGAGTPLLLFAVCMTFFFFLHDPLFILVRVHPRQTGSREKFAAARRYLIVYATVSASAAAALILVYDRVLLIPAAFGALLLLTVQTYLMFARSEKSILGELLAVVGLTSAAPMVRYVLTGVLDDLAALLWVLNIAFFTSSIFYVKMRVERFARKEHAPFRTRHCILYHVFLVVFLGMLSWYGNLSWLIFLAFLPILFRAVGTVWIQDQRLDLMRIGLAEIGYTCLFVLLLSVGLDAFG